MSGQIDRALQFVDWEGGPRLVAGDLIRLLEGHEATPGVPALAVIAEAIEPMAGAEHQEKLAGLRHRIGWTRQSPPFVEPQPAPSVPRPAPPSSAAASVGAIFISYSSDDVSAARQLFDEVKAIGGAVAWFDKSLLKPGDDWESGIMNAIRRCRLFLPLISRQTESRTEGYFRLEWKEAARRSSRIQGRKFIIPIVIDPDYDGRMSRYELVPGEFKVFQYSHAPAGKMTDVLKAELTEQLRILRRAEAKGSAG